MISNCYEVHPVTKPLNCEVNVPGSKSITNRALLLASMADGKSCLSGVLFSDDSRHFMKCVEELGYPVEINEEEKLVHVTGDNGKVPAKKSSIYVGSAGTAARFITAMLALSDGEYTINASEQMKKRPMKPLLDAIKDLGGKIEYLEKEGYLPFILKGGNLEGGKVSLDATSSSQFISALLMTGCYYKNGIEIELKGKRIAQAYIDITITMMKQFGVGVIKESSGKYIVKPGQKYFAQDYKIEPDVSSACYFFAMAAITGGSILVKNVFYSSMQGDIKFLHALEKIGCVIKETENGMLVKGPEGGSYDGIDIDMNDFSDQTMTMAALAPFAKTPTTIRNIGHIRYQESNRVLAIVTELKKMGIECEENEDSITIYPGEPKPSVVETYDDHRMAMAFSLIGLRAEGIQISNPACTAKTFENYFDIFDEIIKKHI